MNRRSFIAAVPAVAFAPAVSAMPTDPHPAWLNEWRDARLSWSAALTEDGDETPHSEAIWARRSELDALIYSTAPQTPAGVIAQLTWIIEDAGGDYASIGHGDALQLSVQTLTSIIA